MVWVDDIDDGQLAATVVRVPELLSGRWVVVVEFADGERAGYMIERVTLRPEEPGDGE